MKIGRATYFKIIIILACILVTAFTLSQYAKLIGHLIKVNYNWQFELFMVIGMLLFQYPFILKRATTIQLNYYYNMLLVSLMGSMMLWPLLIINHYFNVNDVFNIVYFFLVVLFMFFEHKRRVALLQLPVFISYTWVLYRLIILIFIL